MARPHGRSAWESHCQTGAPNWIAHDAHRQVPLSVFCWREVLTGNCGSSLTNCSSPNGVLFTAMSAEILVASGGKIARSSEKSDFVCVQISFQARLKAGRWRLEAMPSCQNFQVLRLMRPRWWRNSCSLQRSSSDKTRPSGHCVLPRLALYP